MRTFHFIFMYRLAGKDTLEDRITIDALNEQRAWSILIEKYHDKFVNTLYSRDLRAVHMFED
jgi:hypothetical protein